MVHVVPAARPAFFLPGSHPASSCSALCRYIQAATSPKDIVIVVDVSGSMKGLRMTIAKHTIVTILDTLGENDFVNIIAVCLPPSIPVLSCLTPSSSSSPPANHSDLPTAAPVLDGGLTQITLGKAALCGQQGGCQVISCLLRRGCWLHLFAFLGM